MNKIAYHGQPALLGKAIAGVAATGILERYFYAGSTEFESAVVDFMEEKAQAFGASLVSSDNLYRLQFFEFGKYGCTGSD